MVDEVDLKLSERIFLQRKRLAKVSASIGLNGGENGSLTGGFLAWVEKELMAVEVDLRLLQEEFERAEKAENNGENGLLN